RGRAPRWRNGASGCCRPGEGTAPAPHRGRPGFWSRRGVARTSLALGGSGRPRDPRPREGRRSVLPGLARAGAFRAEEFRPGLSALQQVLQSFVFGKRPLIERVLG